MEHDFAYINFLTRIRTVDEIKGLKLPGSNLEVKLSIYADDSTAILTLLLRNISIGSNMFGKISGAKIDYDKSKGLYLGKWKSRSDHPFGISWIKYNKILGYYFGSQFSRNRTGWGQRLVFQSRLSTVIKQTLKDVLWFIIEIIVHVTSRIPYTLSYCDHFSTIITFVHVCMIESVRDAFRIIVPLLVHNKVFVWLAPLIIRLRPVDQTRQRVMIEGFNALSYIFF